MEYCIRNMPIKSALKAIDEAQSKTMFVTDENNVLLGALTDGDVRRWILRNGSFDESVYKIMNASPIFLYEKEKAAAFDLMKKELIDAIPILNEKKQIVEVLRLFDFIKGEKSVQKSALDAGVIINAGGAGTRLNPVTLVIPKPLVPVGGVSILERIIGRFSEYSVSEFTVIVNYKKELIKAYFNELKNDYKITFVDETAPMGTIGGLSQIDAQGKSAFVSNCDILIDADYSDILAFHKENGNAMTVVASVKNTRLQYGVIDVDKSGRVTGIREKPEYDFLANTGFYVLEPEIIEDIPSRLYHATDLINECVRREEKVGIYPVSEDCWLDMGQFSEMSDMLDRLSKQGE